MKPIFGGLSIGMIIGSLIAAFAAQFKVAELLALDAVALAIVALLCDTK